MSLSAYNPTSLIYVHHPSSRRALEHHDTRPDRSPQPLRPLPGKDPWSPFETESDALLSAFLTDANVSDRVVTELLALLRSQHFDPKDVTLRNAVDYHRSLGRARDQECDQVGLTPIPLQSSNDYDRITDARDQNQGRRDRVRCLA